MSEKTEVCADCTLFIAPGNGLQKDGEELLPLCHTCIAKRLVALVEEIRACDQI
jgi:hypothetical protein